MLAAISTGQPEHPVGALEDAARFGEKGTESNLKGTPADNEMKVQHKECKIIVAMARLWPFMEAARRTL
jgi:hypothetical protein